MSKINRQHVIDVLKTITDPASGQDVVTAGLVSSIIVKDNTVGFALEIDINQSHEKESLRKACEHAVEKIPGVKRVTVVLTSSREGMLAPRAAKETIKDIRKEQKLQNPMQPISGVGHVIAVASGKGGVGKSTVTVAFARALVKHGYRVGIADADIYGPSIPKMLGLKNKPEINAENKMIPLVCEGIQSASMGYLLDENRAAVWRGPMAVKALFQLMRGTAWDKLDFLLIDMPPGTGDIQLSLAENFPVSGVVLVSTPQEVALLDVKKAENMFRKVHIPILGIVENMSYFIDPASGNRSYIFGESGVKHFAQEHLIRFLGEIPLHPAIREAGDAGTPCATEAAPDDQIFLNAIETLLHSKPAIPAE